MLRLYAPQTAPFLYEIIRLFGDRRSFVRRAANSYAADMALTILAFSA